MFGHMLGEDGSETQERMGGLEVGNKNKPVEEIMIERVLYMRIRLRGEGGSAVGMII